MKKLLLQLLLALPFFATAQTFTSTSGGTIVDNSEVCFPITVSGLPSLIDTSFGVAQVCVNITHTWDGDIDVKLKAPDGTIVVLSNNNGGSGDNYTNSCFAMNGANGNITGGAPPFTGTYIPNNDINGVNNNQNPNGTWFICIADEVPSDQGTFISGTITFAAHPPQGSGVVNPTGPCSTSNGLACQCPDGISTNCDLLPDMTASALIIQQQHTETPGLLTLSNATPNIGWGPMEIHGSNSCWCDTVSVACSTPMCPDGSYPKQKLLQTIYHKNNGVITSRDTLTNGVMSYHPTHGHIHVDNWAEFTLRTPTSNPDATTWPIVSTGTKMSFCLINLGDCTSDYGYCRDGNGGAVLTQANIPNSPFGMVSGCGTDQGIYVGNLDIYSQGMAGMSIDLTGVCNGDYYIVSITDPDNNFFETDDSNNWSATPITLTQQIPGPVGSFTYSVSGSNVQFTNAASVNYTYQWYFGDGGNSTNQNPSHLYTAAGTYNVTMIVSGPCGSDTTTQIITITSVGIEESASAAMGFSAYPNPISENTIVSYFLNEKSNVILELYNALGQKVNMISKGIQEQGFYEFNYNMKNLNLENGVYILQIKTDSRSASIRLIQLN